MDKIIFLLLRWMVLISLVSSGFAEPVANCPSHTETFVADHENACIYYWCVRGEFLPYQFPCGPGSAVPRNFVSSGNPCIVHSGECAVAEGFLEPDGPYQPEPHPEPGPGPAPYPEPEPKPNQGILVEDFHLFGGDYIPGIRDINDCFHACARNKSCLAFDFNHVKYTCFFHTLKTACNKPFPKPACIHYTWVDCPDTPVTPTTTTTVPTTPTPTPGPKPQLPPISESFPGRHILDGTLVPKARDLLHCLASCTGNCTGVDFNVQQDTCFIHNDTTECNGFVNKPHCTHFRINYTCEPPTTVTTTAQTTTRGPTTGPTTRGPTTAPPGPLPGQGQDQVPSAIPEGFLGMAGSAHIRGGLLIASNVNLMQCLDVCRMLPECLSLDYNIQDRTCWAHGTETYCNDILYKPQCIHFKRLPCLSDAANVYVQTLHQFQLQGAQEYCTGCSLTQCLDDCAHNQDCFGVDYDNRTQGCWFHSLDSVCTTALAKAYCNHYSKYQCVISSTPAPIPAPTLHPTGATINFPTPTVLPSKWAAYPGTSISGATFIGKVSSGDICLEKCAEDSECLAFDFNAATGGCWHHGKEQTCVALNNAPSVYHGKKWPICTSDENGEPYPIPSGINP